ncbi:SDR family oxidoreductase [Sulfitobacter sp. HNIBRBA3233]|uniref:SDR family NAD(P)-dependent oxidoreductase n=1 Tax=Sulfitobacter marinivivus TaxID=3158558 RepID=UPI0032DED451
MTRTALVTGVVGGIGAAIARQLVDAGYDVRVTDMPGTALDDAAGALGLPAYPADLGHRDSVAEMVAALPARPDILVNAAGGVRGQTGRPLVEVSEEDWRAIFAANVDSAFFLAQSCAPAMAERGWGRIVTISSGAGLRPSLTGIQAYTSAKHALVGLTKQLSLEFGPQGVTVNSVAPGFVRSNPATERQWDAMGADGQRALLSRIHTRRLGRPEDIAQAVGFLCSDAAEWISGQILSVDGGVT